MLNSFLTLCFSLIFISNSLFSMRGPYNNRYRSYSSPFHNRSNNTSEQRVEFDEVKEVNPSKKFNNQYRPNTQFGASPRFGYQNRSQFTQAPQRDMNKGVQSNQRSLMEKPDSIQSKVQKELEESGQKGFKVSIDSSSGTATVKKGNLSMECNPSQKGDCVSVAKELSVNSSKDDKN